jgi:hypothetical protein
VAGLLGGAGPVEPGITPTPHLTGAVEAAEAVHSGGHQTAHLESVFTC